MRHTVWYRGTGTLDSGQNGKVTMVSHCGAIRQMAGVSRALGRSQLPNTGQTLLLGTKWGLGRLEWHGTRLSEYLASREGRHADWQSL